VDSGIRGVGDLGLGTHLCALYSGPAELDGLIMPFIEAGLREGDKCLCLIDQVEPRDVRQRLVDEHAGGNHLRAGQLDVDRASDVYLKSGRFSAEHMRSFLQDTAHEAADNEFPHMRAAGEMSWVLPGPPGADDYFAYESSINEMQTRIPSVLMCMYDLEMFGTSMLVDVLKTHPKVLIGDTVLDNPDYLTPEEYLKARRPAIMPQSSLDGEHVGTAIATMMQSSPGPRRSPGSDGWHSLTKAERRVSRLVAGGLTNKLIAKKLSLSHHTVDAHLKHIFTKLDIHSRVELTVLAMKYSR
jgi:DNA-binding CsgD family transcriptional regulator